MKKVFTGMFMLLMMVSLQSLAQFNQGRWLVDGTLSLSWNNTETYQVSSNQTFTSRSRVFGFAPRAGYFFLNRVAGGLILDYSNSHNEFKSFDSQTGNLEDAASNNTSVSAGPFIRYYLPMAIFFQASATFGTQKYKGTYPNFTSEGKASLRKWALAVGYAYFINDYVAIEPSIGYQSDGYRTNSDNKTTTGSIALSAGLAIYLGERK